MQLLGAEVRAVIGGSQTLTDAVSESMRDWVTNIKDTYYLLGSVLGPHPYPEMVRDFQSVIGFEAREQILEKTSRLPTELIACVGGGSNAIGLFTAFLNDKEVQMTGVEAGGRGIQLEKKHESQQEHAARFATGSVGVFQGTKSFVLQTPSGQIQKTHSISAGLDYAAVGPEHAYLRHVKRAKYTFATDGQAVEAFHRLARTEGILPALESSHAIAYAIERAAVLKETDILLVCLSGRGDKDLQTILCEGSYASAIS